MAHFSQLNSFSSALPQLAGAEYLFLVLLIVATFPEVEPKTAEHPCLEGGKYQVLGTGEEQREHSG